jgi:hypothetical protein
LDPDADQDPSVLALNIEIFFKNDCDNEKNLYNETHA